MYGGKKKQTQHLCIAQERVRRRRKLRRTENDLNWEQS